MTARRIDDHDPACIDEKKALARAKQRLEIAQEKVEAVRHCARAIDRAVDEYRGARTPLSSWLESEAPKALAALRRMMDNLEDYLALQAPGAGSGEQRSWERDVAASAGRQRGISPHRSGRNRRGVVAAPAPPLRPTLRPSAPTLPCSPLPAPCRGRRHPMRLWDLTSGAAKLELALKTLQTKTADIGDAWSDEAYARFLETYLEPIEPRMKTMIDAIHRLSEVLNSAERQCRDENS